jgi:hypothetical protein
MFSFSAFRKLKICRGKKNKNHPLTDHPKTISDDILLYFILGFLFSNLGSMIFWYILIICLEEIHILLVCSVALMCTCA